MTINELKKLKQEVKDELLRKPNVVGVSVGKKVVGGKPTDELAIRVLVRTKIPIGELKEEDVVPKQVSSGDLVAKTDVVEVGDIRILTLCDIKGSGGWNVKTVRPEETPKQLTGKRRPLRAGFSTGHPNITAGTLGCFVANRFAAIQAFALSNNHVYACSSLKGFPKAERGDPLLQPGAYDGGTHPEDTFGRLWDWVPLDWTENRIDMAVGTLDVATTYLIHELGIPAGVIWADDITLGWGVIKVGRTTELTEGEITDIDASVAVDYGYGKPLLFEDQILTTRMLRGGDSGSVLLTRRGNYVVALGFAGSPAVSVFSPVKYLKASGYSPIDYNWYHKFVLIKRDWHNVYDGCSWKVRDDGLVAVRRDSDTEIPRDDARAKRILKRWGDRVSWVCDRLYLRDKALLLATVAVESDGDPDAFRCERRCNPSIGLAQVSYRTARWLGFKGSVRQLFDVETNLEYAAKYILWQSGFKYTFGDPPKVAAAYNAGGLYRSDKNRWHLRSTGSYIDDFVAVYNSLKKLRYVSEV